MNFTTQTLKDALNELANAGKVFSNESQFQFDLAWQLKEMGFEVELEVLSANCSLADFINLSKEERMKYYTDIIVKDDENNYIAIELKYKTPGIKGIMCYTAVSGEKYYVAPQGAENISAYLYWKDVERLEHLIGGKIPLNFDDSKKVGKGYAVLLTNDEKYWGSNISQVSLAKEFLPLYENKVVRNESLCWWVKYNKITNKVLDGRQKSSAMGYKRIETEDDAKSLCKKKIREHYPIKISGTYKCTWLPYGKFNCSISGNNKKIYADEFKYLILEIK